VARSKSKNKIKRHQWNMKRRRRLERKKAARAQDRG
jgi:hypothetical protein